MTTNNALHLVWDNHLENVSSLFQLLYQNNKFVDVTIACRDGFLRAHKLILSACSPYFERIFQENPCKHPVVIIRGVHYQEMQMVLEYIYKGYIDIPANLLNSLISVASELEIKGFENFNNYQTGNSSETSSDQHYGKHEGDNNRLTRTEEPSTSTLITRKKVGAGGASNYLDIPHKIQLPYMDKKRYSKQNSGAHVNSSNDRKDLPNISDTLNVESGKFMEKMKFNLSSQLTIENITNDRNQWLDSDDLYEERSSNDSDVDYIPNGPGSGDLLIARKSASICTICLYKCKTKKDLIVHQKSHHKSGKPHKCEFCPSSFTRSSHLARHRRMHTGERPFSCVTCGKSFARQDKLKQHTRTAHELLKLNEDVIIQETVKPTAEYKPIVLQANLEKLEQTPVLPPTVTPVPTPTPVLTPSIPPQTTLCVIAKTESYAEIEENNGDIQTVKKRGRGRPRKRPLGAVPAVLFGPKRKRGRPRKIPIVDDDFLPQIKQECSSPKEPNYTEMYPMLQDSAEHITIEPLIEINTGHPEVPSNCSPPPLPPQPSSPPPLPPSLPPQTPSPPPQPPSSPPPPSPPSSPPQQSNVIQEIQQKDQLPTEKINITQFDNCDGSSEITITPIKS